MVRSPSHYLTAFTASPPTPSPGCLSFGSIHSTIIDLRKKNRVPFFYVYNSASGANIVVNGLTGAFSGLAIDSYAADLAAGSLISVTSTLTFYADPASIDTFAPELNLLPGVSLPGEVLFGSSVPEPSTAVMGGTALLVLSAFGWLRRRRR